MSAGGGLSIIIKEDDNLRFIPTGIRHYSTTACQRNGLMLPHLNHHHLPTTSYHRIPAEDSFRWTGEMILGAVKLFEAN